MQKPWLSIIIPVYNEQKTVKSCLDRVMGVNFQFPTEVIVVNDGSTDNTLKILEKIPGIKLLSKPNGGKGTAVRAGIQAARGEYIVIQDADLEYDPNDIKRLVAEVRNGATIVYGSRLIASPSLSGEKRTPFLVHYFGNRFLSLMTSLLYGTWLTDMETCYKIFPKSLVEKFPLHARGFEIEPELTAKLLKSGNKIKEISITTNPRGYDEGKKIRAFKDGLKALYSLIKYRFIS